jgi:hypothetical protein
MHGLPGQALAAGNQAAFVAAHVFPVSVFQVAVDGGRGRCGRGNGF